jgi:hypothetical protein
MNQTIHIDTIIYLRNYLSLTPEGVAKLLKNTREITNVITSLQAEGNPTNAHIADNLAALREDLYK